MASATFGDFVQLSRKMPIPDPPATPTDYPFDLPVRDGRTTRVRVHKPSSTPSSGSPLFILLHGGGFCLGDPSMVAADAKAIASTLGAVVVAPSYRLAPENPFPAAAHDVWDTLTWLAQPSNASTLGADLSAGFVIGGISAGANLAAVAAQRYVTANKSADAPKLTGVLLIIPYVLEPELVPADKKDLWFSREQNADALVINAKTMDWITKSYKQDARSPDFSPFNVEGAHAGMPPAYFQVAGQDPLRDDGLVYERVLRENGVRTRLDAYPGVPHGHKFTFPMLKSAVKSNVDFVKGAAWLAGKELADEEASEAYAAAAASVTPQAAARVN